MPFCNGFDLYLLVNKINLCRQVLSSIFISLFNVFKLDDQTILISIWLLGELHRKAIVCVSGCGESKEAVEEIKQIGKEKVW